MRRLVLLPILLVVAACAGGVAEGEQDDPSAASKDPLRDGGLPVTTRERACAMQSARAERDIDKAVDIIFVIDNSGSMGDEIEAVRENINDNFARIIADSGVDYRVFMLSRFGTDGTTICVDPPLASEGCEAGIWGAESDVLFHYDVEIQSNDAFCRILETFDRPDPYQLAPAGWGALLRPDAQKIFVVITDDSASCTYGKGDDAVVFGNGVFGETPDEDPFTDALLFHQSLLARSPEQFGVPPDIKYRFYSIVGMRQSDTLGAPYFPHESVVDERCDSAASAGRAYQALSIVTDALRYPVCEGRGFDAVFGVLARGVVESAKADCIFEIPAAPAGESIDRSTINVEYTPGDGGDTRRLSSVARDADCQSDHFVLEADRIVLCPDACQLLEADPRAKVNVLYACLPTVI